MIHFEPACRPCVGHVEEFRSDFAAGNKAVLILTASTRLIDDIWIVANPCESIVLWSDDFGEFVVGGFEERALGRWWVFDHHDHVATVLDKILRIRMDAVFVVEYLE